MPPWIRTYPFSWILAPGGRLRKCVVNDSEMLFNDLEKLFCDFGTFFNDLSSSSNNFERNTYKGGLGALAPGPPL